MKAKVVTFRIKPEKESEVICLFNEFIVPGAKKYKGFRGGLLLTVNLSRNRGQSDR